MRGEGGFVRPSAVLAFYSRRDLSPPITKDNYIVIVWPEPAPLSLLSLSLIGIWLRKRRSLQVWHSGESHSVFAPRELTLQVRVQGGLLPG